jgi:small-conductance mechanosensitive channel/CRP-like cAMP-binding protein
VTLSSLLKAYPVLLGLGLGVVVVLVVALVLPRHERRLARGPLILLAIYGLARASMAYVPPNVFPSKVLHFIAVFAWCAAIVRSAFVLFTRTGLSRVAGGAPWPKILRDVVQAIVYFAVGLIALRAIGVEPGSLLTTSALLTAVLGLSMQETLGNLFAGLALQSQQTLTVGDWVRFADGPEGFGEVTEVNWRSTHFLTNNRVQIIVPNGVIARSVLRNYSRPTRIVRHDIEITLPYGVLPEQARNLILAAVRGTEGVLTEPEPFVLLGQFNDAGATYSIRCFINDYGRRDPVDSAVRQRVLYALRRSGIEVPYPNRQVTFVGSLPTASPKPDLAHSRPPPPNLGIRLERFELFRGLDDNTLGRLTEGVTPLFYSPGEAIIRQGEAGAELFALERGRVEILVTPEGRPPVRVGVLEAGAIFGEAAFLTGERRVATIVALTECEVIRIRRSAFQQLLDENPGLSERLTGLLAKRMDELGQAVSDVGQPEHTDGERRSDILISRIRQFFGN